MRQTPLRLLERKVRDVRFWHFADNPVALAFVGYWTNNGHRSALGLNGSAANDPFPTLVGVAAPEQRVGAVQGEC